MNTLSTKSQCSITVEKYFIMLGAPVNTNRNFSDFAQYIVKACNLSFALKNACDLVRQACCKMKERKRIKDKRQKKMRGKEQSFALVNEQGLVIIYGTVR